MSYVVVSVSDPDYDDEYKGKLLLCFEVELQARRAAGEPQQCLRLPVR